MNICLHHKLIPAFEPNSCNLRDILLVLSEYSCWQNVSEQDFYYKYCYRFCWKFVIEKRLTTFLNIIRTMPYHPATNMHMHAIAAGVLNSMLRFFRRLRVLLVSMCMCAHNYFVNINCISRSWGMRAGIRDCGSCRHIFTFNSRQAQTRQQRITISMLCLRSETGWDEHQQLHATEKMPVFARFAGRVWCVRRVRDTAITIACLNMGMLAAQMLASQVSKKRAENPVRCSRGTAQLLCLIERPSSARQCVDLCCGRGGGGGG